MIVRIWYIARVVVFVWIALLAVGSSELTSRSGIGRAKADEQTADTNEKARPTMEEARARARLLHETIHGALQVMHRDFFHEDEKLRIPSRSLEDVFVELTRSHNVELRWLAVNTDAMNIDHNPKTEFEKYAVKALSSGEEEFELGANNIYRFAGTIRLSSVCLKCHVPNRTSTKDRAAALVISMPLKNE